MIRKISEKAEHILWIRACVAPIKNIKREIGRKHFSKSYDSKYLKSLYNIHKGERCFIIGNGPSLNPADLDLLQEKKEFCFGTNRIYEMFSKTKWRPDYYICIDPVVISHEISRIDLIEDVEIIFLSTIARSLKPTNPKIHYVYEYGKFEVNKYNAKKISMSEDVSKYVSICYSVTTTAIQMAIYMGFNDIYLLGVDHSYAFAFDSNGKVVKGDSEKSYFSGSDTPSYSIHNVNSATQGYIEAKKFAEKKNRNIYNATRGGKLEVFERVDFDDLMGKGERQR